MVTRRTPPGGDTPETDVADELWQFSCDVFEDEGVAKACLALQDDTGTGTGANGADVNIILFITWLVVKGRGPLDETFLAAVIKTGRPWQKDVVLPLRTLRRELKAMSVPEARKIRASVQQSEIAAERAEQTALVEVMAILKQDDDVLTPTAAGAELWRVLGNYMDMISGNEAVRTSPIPALIRDYVTAAERVLSKRSVHLS